MSHVSDRVVDTSNDHPTNAPRVGAIISSITDTAVSDHLDSPKWIVLTY